MAALLRDSVGLAVALTAALFLLREVATVAGSYAGHLVFALAVVATRALLKYDRTVVSPPMTVEEQMKKFKMLLFACLVAYAVLIKNAPPAPPACDELGNFFSAGGQAERLRIVWQCADAYNTQVPPHSPAPLPPPRPPAEPPPPIISPLTTLHSMPPPRD
jgi:hypothetical protein